MAEFASTHPLIDKGAPATLPPTPTPALGVQINVWQNPWNPKQPADYLWRGYINGDLVTVWAGSTINLLPGGGVEETQQGYVGVAVGTDLTGPNRNYHEYLTSKQAGTLKITAVNGTVVSLVAKDGTIFTFNLDTRTFS